MIAALVPLIKYARDLLLIDLIRLLIENSERVEAHVIKASPKTYWISVPWLEIEMRKRRLTDRDKTVENRRVRLEGALQWDQCDHLHSGVCLL